MIARNLARWALRMALLWALKKGIEKATRPTRVGRTTPRRRPSASDLQALH